MTAPPLPLRLRHRRPAVPNSTAPVRTLLLHGMGGGVGNWDPIVPTLAPHLDVWDVVMPWSTTGDTTWARDSDVASLGTRVIEAAEAAAVGELGLLVAHSFAANVVLELLHRVGPRWTVPVVLVAPFFRSDPRDFEWSVISYYENGFRRMLDEGLKLRAGDRIDETTRVAMADRLSDLMGPYTWLRFFDTYLRTPLLHLRDLTAPMLVVAGEHDVGAHPAGARELAELIPTASWALLPGCGHFPMIECPAELAGLINDFVTTQTVLAPCPRLQRTNEFTLERTT